MDLLDESTLAGLRARDPGAIEVLVERAGPILLRLAHRLTGDLDTARDLRQLALLRAVEGASGFEGRARFSTWLHRLMVNLCRDHVRRTDARAKALDLAVRRNSRSAVHEPADRPAERGEAAARVAEALGALPSDEREAIVLRHYHDLPFPEVAAVLGAPVTTVKSRVARGMRRLEILLAEYEPQE